MGRHARIEIDRIVIDTTAWLEQRTAGPLPGLTRQLRAWARAHRPDGAEWPEAVLAWCAAHGYRGPDRTDQAGPLVIHHELTRLDADLWLACARHPTRGRFVVVQRDDREPRIYTDYTTREIADWDDADSVDIACPRGHGWTWLTGTTLLDGQGSFTCLSAVFGTDPDAPFTGCPHCAAFRHGQRARPCGCDRSSWITCPACGARCDAELPAR
jgi:hypothetical protein